MCESRSVHNGGHRAYLGSGMIKGIIPQTLALETAEGGVVMEPI
jgi:hypothetical protein